MKKLELSVKLADIGKFCYICTRKSNLNLPIDGIYISKRMGRNARYL